MNNTTKGFVILMLWLVLWNLNVQHQNHQLDKTRKELDEQIDINTKEKEEQDKTIKRLQEQVDTLNKQNQELETTNKKLKNQAKKELPPKIDTEVAKTPKVSRGAVPKHKNFKAYMDYRTITNTSSKQHQLQQQAYTDGAGFRRLGGAYMIALGSYWGNVGDYVTVEMGNTTIQCIIGDQKADIHTDSMNRLHYDNSLIEFIIDKNQLSSDIKIQGDCSANPLVNFTAPVTNIYK